jgi:putative N6-adenine-specific DNA methylase
MTQTTQATSSTRFDYFAPCPRGLEGPLAAELREIGARVPLETGAEVPGGVHFRGGWPAGMAANLHSRIASRVLLKVGRGRYRDEHDVYALALEEPWEQWFNAAQTLRVDVTAIKAPLKSLEFTTLRIKDAICDRLRDKTGARPDIDTVTPDVRVFGFLTATDCTLYLDTSGEPLFKRGWRLDKGAAPLRENLAAGILRLTGWTPGIPLYDPMCGSGTFIAEAAQVALAIPPGGARRFGFEALKRYDVGAWKDLQSAAREAQAAAVSSHADLAIFGSDISGDMLVKARANLARAGLPELSLKQLDARSMVAPGNVPGIVVANPPYGERIEVRGRGPRESRADHAARQEREERHQAAGSGWRDSNDGNDREGRAGRPEEGGREGEEGFRRARSEGDEADADFFRQFGDSLKQRFTGWRAFVLTSDRKLPGLMRLRESTKTPLFNGALECRLFRFDLIAGQLRQRQKEEPPAAAGD